MSFRSNRLLAQVVKSSEVKLSTKCGSVATRSVATIQSQGQSEAKFWSQSISFASPESDFTSKSIRSVTSTSAAHGKGEKVVGVPYIAIPTWSENISFTSPEADFTSPSSYRYGSKDLDTTVESESMGGSWSETLSFASPESDFTGTALNTIDENVDVASSSKEDFINHMQSQENHRNNMAYSISYASAESDFSNPAFMDLLDERQKKQLENCSLLHDDNREEQMMKGELSKKVNPRELKLTNSEAKSLREDFALDESARATTTSSSSISSSSTLDIFHEGPLPHTLAEATVANDPRAIVITEAQVPFRIKMVNDSWEKLCGYTIDECQDKTLACLQGPETNKAAVTALMSQLMNGEEAGTVLTNYTKLGRKFHNRLRVGPLKNDSGEVTHFVGVLCEVNEKGEHFLPEGGHASQMAM